MKAINTGTTNYFSGGWAQWATHFPDLDGERRDDLLLYNPAAAVFVRPVTDSPGALTYTSGQFPR